MNINLKIFNFKYFLKKIIKYVPIDLVLVYISVVTNMAATKNKPTAITSINTKTFLLELSRRPGQSEKNKRLTLIKCYKFYIFFL